MPAKNRPPLVAVAVVTSPEAEDAVAELLARTTGTSPVTALSRVTGLCTCTAFLPETPPRGLRAALRTGLAEIAACGLEIAPARTSIRRVPPHDWRESWKRHFRPLVFGRHLLVRPSWSQRRAVPGQAEITLDPGLSFGTGQHATTEFCLREIVRLRPRNPKATPCLLDVGTGSGILAIAAAKLGYRPVEAFDFDPEAVHVARKNARKNRVDTRLNLRQDDVARLSARPRVRHAVVCANLTADLLLLHAKRLVAQVQRPGHLVLAGILAEEFDRVAAAFTALGLTLVRSRHRKEWRSGSFRVDA